MKLLQNAFEQGQVILDLEATDMGAIFHDTVQEMVRRGLLPSSLGEEVERALSEREAQAPTAIGNSISVPHTYLEGIERPMVFFVRLARPVNLGAPDGIPIRFLFFLLGPPGAAERHLDTLAGIARLTSEDEFRFDASQARSATDLVRALEEFFRRTTPPAKPAEPGLTDGLVYTGRLFGGLINDLQRRLPHYASDFRDGLHSKSIASMLFLFFACLAPAVTFGGIMGKMTESHIGAVEMIVASAVCGLVYALAAGQPLIILGGTGPMLVFTALLYSLCVRMGVQEYFLECLACVGLWTALLLLVLAATDASCLLRYFTRFTDEIFAALISVIFISAALEALLEVVREVYQEETSSHDRALVPLLLAFGTFGVAMALSRFRRSRYLLPWMREFLADFGPAIALAAMTAAALL